MTLNDFIEAKIQEFLSMDWDEQSRPRFLRAALRECAEKTIDQIVDHDVRAILKGDWLGTGTQEPNPIRAAEELEDHD